MQAEKAWTWRVEHIPQGTTRRQLELFFVEADRPRLFIESLVPESIAPDLFYHGSANHYLTATISFRAQEGCRPRLVDDLDGKMGVDADFYGFTTLYSSEKEPIAADVVAVTGLAGHAFGSWMHSRTPFRTRMWLRDYLPEEVPNIRVLIYGYPSALENSVSTISLFEHSNNFKERLLAMRRAAQCEMRPIVFIGHSLGCLIVKRVVVDVNRTEELLPVRSFIFLGAPHRGLEITALKMLVQGTSSESNISELKEGSSVLEILDHDFEKYFKRSTVQILTCYESYPTSTVIKSSDGSLKRDGVPIMMVTKARAHLGYEDNEIGVYSDHSKIAKIDISTTGPYLSIKQAIDRAIVGNSVQQGSFGHPAIHLSSNSPIRRSVSAGPFLKDDEESRTGVTPGLAVPLGRSKSLTDREGKAGSVTMSGPKSSRHRTDRVGEDLPINRAIHDGDVAKVKKLLKDAHLDKPDSQGYTPLMVAAATEQEQIVNDLIRRGASMKISGPKGDTAFHLACRHGGAGVTSIFLKHAELLDIRGAKGRTPLMSSIRGSRADTAKLLLHSTGNVEASDEDGKTALHYAAMNGQTEVVRLLLMDRGANQDRTTKEKGWTPLHYAAQRCHPQVVELLGKNGADCNALTSEEDGARSAIHLILLKPGRTRCITLLVRYGAEIEQPDGAGKTPLHWAAQHGEPDSIKWLVSKKANLEARTGDIDKRTPLHIAVEAKRLDIARSLLDAGANKDAAMVFPRGKTALHIATEQNNIDLVKELLARKANVDPIYNADPLTYPAIMPTSRNITPLWIATEDESLEIMRLLLKAGADVEGKSPNIEPRPLVIAVLKGNLAAVRTLLEYDAAPETKGPATPLTEATKAGNIPIMKALLTRGVGADVERTNDKGYPCLFIAATLGHVDAVELLLNHGADPKREVVVESLLSSNKTRKAGEYFKSYVSAQSQGRIREMLRNCLWKR